MIICCWLYISPYSQKHTHQVFAWVQSIGYLLVACWGPAVKSRGRGGCLVCLEGSGSGQLQTNFVERACSSRYLGWNRIYVELYFLFRICLLFWAHTKSINIKNWFMLSVLISSYGCTREVWRARKKRWVARGAAESNSNFLSIISPRAGKGDPDCSKTKLPVRLHPREYFFKISPSPRAILVGQRTKETGSVPGAAFRSSPLA